MKVRFCEDKNHIRWVSTDGLQKLGQREIAVTVPWPKQDPRDISITRLFQFIENYLMKQTKRILPKQTMHYGWNTLRFVADEYNISGIGTNTLLIEERTNSLPEEASYMPGISRTIALQQLQDEAMRRNHITGDAIYPNYSQFALTCKRVTPKTIRLFRPLRMHRAYEPDVQESGWFLGCCDEGHDHDNSDELGMTHLHHLVEQFPGLFPYLAMPIDTLLVFGEDQVIVFRPNEQEGQLDSENLLTSLP